jgi:hypothetical protein
MIPEDESSGVPGGNLYADLFKPMVFESRKAKNSGRNIVSG